MNSSGESFIEVAKNKSIGGDLAQEYTGGGWAAWSVKASSGNELNWFAE